MNENIEILNHIHKDAKMGAQADTTLLDTIKNKDNKLKPVIEENLKKYEKFIEESENYLTQYDASFEDNGPLTKMSSWMGIKAEVIKDNSDSALATMLIEGLTMGSLETSKKIKSYEDSIDKDVLNLAKDFHKFQEDALEKLKKFL